MRNIFHIGFHKTATTWFQKKFYAKVDNLLMIERRKIRDYFYRNIEQDFGSETDLLFCDEELSGNIHNAGLSGFLSREVANKISEFKNPKVIIFIRNQYDIISSSYLQYIKKGGNYSLNKYLYHTDFQNPNRSSLFSFSHFNYLEKIQQYERLIGKENVFVYLYEDFLENQKDFLKDFISQHNFKLELNNVSLQKSNKSYSYLSLFVARILNSFSRKDILYKYYIFHIPYFYEASLKVVSLFNFGSIKHSCFLGRKNRKRIHSEFSGINKKIEDIYGLDLEKYKYPL